MTWPRRKPNRRTTVSTSRSFSGFSPPPIWRADCVGLLDKTKKLKLAHLVAQYGGEKSWQQLVEERFGIDPTFVKTISTLCLERGKTDAQAINFMLRGFGCPEPEERMIEVLASRPEDRAVQ